MGERDNKNECYKEKSLFFLFISIRSSNGYK